MSQLKLGGYIGTTGKEPRSPAYPCSSSLVNFCPKRSLTQLLPARKCNEIMAQRFRKKYNVFYKKQVTCNQEFWRITCPLMAPEPTGYKTQTQIPTFPVPAAQKSLLARRWMVYH